MKAMKVIKDPEAFQLLADDTRRKTVLLLRVKEMTVSQIATELNLTPQAVYHHIKKLLKAEMIEVAREERVDHIIESYYRATAESFYFSEGKTPRSKEAAKEQVTSVLNALKRLGFEIEFDDKNISRLVDLKAELDQCCKSEKIVDKIAELDDVDLLTKQSVEEYAEYLLMSDKEFDRLLEIDREFRDSLKSLLKKQSSAKVTKLR